jgi:hypothetical protein
VVKVLPGKAQILPQTFPFSGTALLLQRPRHTAPS